MHTFQGKRVSYPWYVILNEAAKTIRFQLNSGNRTLAEQRSLFAQNMYPDGSGPRPGHALTARPNPNAPHIKQGHVNHALDVDSWNNGENRLQAWVQARGCPLVNNVGSESWHLDPVNEAKLIALANRILAARYVTLNSRGKAQFAVKRQLRQLGYLKIASPLAFGPTAFKALKRFQKAKGLVADGVAGPLTLKALASAVKAKKKR